MICEIKMALRARGRSNLRNVQRRNRLRSRISQGACYYHQRFGKNAQQCTQPCFPKVLSKPEN